MFQEYKSSLQLVQFRLCWFACRPLGSGPFESYFALSAKTGLAV
jgi:hypothetical protein